MNIQTPRPLQGSAPRPAPEAAPPAARPAASPAAAQTSWSTVSTVARPPTPAPASSFAQVEQNRFQASASSAPAKDPLQTKVAIAAKKAAENAELQGFSKMILQPRRPEAASPASPPVSARGAAIEAKLRQSESIFAAKEGWTRPVSGGAVEGRYKIIDGKSFAESRMRVQASPEEVVKKLADPASWNAWYGGEKDGKRTQTVFNARAGDHGTTRYDLQPTGQLELIGFKIDGLKVHETMYPPTRLEGGGYRIPIELEGGARGLAYMDVRPLPGGGAEILGRFNGVEPGLFTPFTTKRFTENHLLVEAGKSNEIPFLGGLFGSGGGFPELAKQSGWAVLPAH